MACPVGSRRCGAVGAGGVKGVGPAGCVRVRWWGSVAGWVGTYFWVFLNVVVLHEFWVCLNRAGSLSCGGVPALVVALVALVTHLEGSFAAGSVGRSSAHPAHDRRIRSSHGGWHIPGSHTRQQVKKRTKIHAYGAAGPARKTLGCEDIQATAPTSEIRFGGAAIDARAATFTICGSARSAAGADDHGRVERTHP